MFHLQIKSSHKDSISERQTNMESRMFCSTSRLTLGQMQYWRKSSSLTTKTKYQHKVKVVNVTQQTSRSNTQRSNSTRRHCPHNAGVSHILKTMSKVCKHLRCMQQSPESIQMSKRHHIPTHMHKEYFKYTANAPGRIRPQSCR